jgi:hypothetical protein
MAISSVSLGPWKPDIAIVDSGATADITNCLVHANHYGPLRAPYAVTTALPGPCKGAFVARLEDGSSLTYAGTAGKLYRYNPTTGGWTDVSKLATTYSVPEEHYWSFAQFGNLLIATNVNSPVQVIDVDAGANFADLAGTPPQAQFVTVVGGFVVLIGLLDFPRRVQWSGLEDPDFWTAGLNFSDLQDFPDGGNITGIAGGEYGIIFQENAIRQMTFAPGTPEVFQFSKIEDGRGSVAPWAVVRVGPRTFFLYRDGFYAFAGGQSVPIGDADISRWFVANIDPNAIGRAVAAVDVVGARILWAFKSQSASDPALLDKAVVYDYGKNKWVKWEIPARYWFSAFSPSVSIDSMTGVDIDVLSGSLDSAIYAGGIPALALFNTVNTMNFLEGENLEATIETADAMVARPNRAFIRGVRLDSDATSFFARIGTKEQLSETTTWTAESQPSITGFAPFRITGRYQRGKIRIPAGTTWTYAAQFEVDAKAAGFR